MKITKKIIINPKLSIMIEEPCWVILHEDRKINYQRSLKTQRDTSMNRQRSVGQIMRIIKKTHSCIQMKKTIIMVRHQKTRDKKITTKTYLYPIQILELVSKGQLWLLVRIRLSRVEIVVELQIVDLVIHLGMVIKDTKYRNLI